MRSARRSPQISPRSVSFLLGAGASAEAGIGTMRELGESFLATFGVPELMDSLATFSEELEKLEPEEWGKNRNLEVLLRFLQGIKVASSLTEHLRCRAAAILAFEAKKFLLKQVSLHKQDLSYMDGFKAFLPIQGACDVYTLNYDTVFEDWCSQNGITLADGFGNDGTWTPELFYYRNASVRLWKLHGSVNWVNRYGQITKSAPAGSWIAELRSGKMSSLTLDVALIYPAAGKVPEGLLGHLNGQFHERIKRTRLLVAVGYRFADEHIRSAVTDALNTNPHLSVLLCSPSASCLRFRLCDSVWSAFADRVHAFDCNFGDALVGALRNFVIALVQERVCEDTLPLTARCFGLQTGKPTQVCMGQFSNIGILGDSLILTQRRPHGRGSVMRFDLRTSVMETVVGGFGDPKSFAVVGRERLIVADRRFGNKSTGLGAVWAVDLGTGVKQLVSRLPIWIWRIPGTPRLLAASLRTGGDALSLGVLSWPTGVAPTPDCRGVLITESRRVVHADLSSCRFTPITSRRFLNMASIVHLKHQTYLLLEHVFAQDPIGVLWQLDLGNSASILPVAGGLQRTNCLVVHPSGNAVLVGQVLSDSRWQLLSVDLNDGRTTPIGPPLEGNPRFAVYLEETLFYLTSHGVLAAQLP